jgi:putative phosphoserine phosphatase/1-acylglycerol-3-phosphate O-acyltransferase
MDPKTWNYIAFFDLDKTALSINSGPFLVREAFKGGFMSAGDLLKAIYLSWLYKLNLRETTLILSGMGKWLKGKTAEEFNILAEHVVSKHIIIAIRPEIVSEISFHRKHNAEIVILSSGMKEICRLIGSHLGVDNCICTTMEMADGVYTGFPENKYCFDDEKRVRLIEYCEVSNYKLSEAWYYGDSISDLAALEVVGHPVCVSPDKKLAIIARERGWRVF